MGTGARKATRNLGFSASKYLRYLYLICVHRGGIAVVWLGKIKDRFVAMKQFPKTSGKQVDQSAYIEF